MLVVSMRGSIYITEKSGTKHMTYDPRPDWERAVDRALTGKRGYHPVRMVLYSDGFAIFCMCLVAMLIVGAGMYAAR